MLPPVHESECHVSVKESVIPSDIGVTRKIESVQFIAIGIIITAEMNQGWQ